MGVSRRGARIVRRRQMLNRTQRFMRNPRCRCYGFVAVLCGLCLCAVVLLAPQSFRHACYGGAWRGRAMRSLFYFCHAQSVFARDFDPSAPLVYDVGHHEGGDTSYYLHRGRRVVAIEASPLLVQSAVTTKFPVPLATKQLVLLNVGIGPSNDVTLPFYLNKHETAFSSFVKEIACRVPGDCDHCPAKERVRMHACEEVQVPMVTCSSLIQKYGRPSFMKIDIEGHDHFCYSSLKSLPHNLLPLQLSMESYGIDTYDFFRGLGYTKFKHADQTQTRYHNPFPSTGEQYSNDYQFSGGLPDEIVDAASGTTKWVNYFEAKQAYSKSHDCDLVVGGLEQL